MRVTAALAAGMLALGVAIGAAIGPAPDASFAGASEISKLIPALAATVASSAAHRAAAPTTATATPPSAQAQPTPAAKPASSAASPSNAGTGATAKATQPKSPSSSAPSSGEGEGAQQAKLPPVTSIWLITLSGGTFSQILAQPAAAPYVTAQLLPAGTLLSEWSAIDASSLAAETPLLTGKPPQLLDTIVQPPCPEGAAGEGCKPETAGALAAADEFLKQTVPTITSTAAYRERGLIAITFGAVGNATASGLPAGASTATLSAEPPAGVLLISPHVKKGVRSSRAYDPTSPVRSLEALLH
ncbi:MAG TPA: hypothetical protein VL972_05930 [Solirubrobacteraceae bacterium]|nr:hypothetical protein [Solirubrobacteraceae bacterium]